MRRDWRFYVYELIDPRDLSVFYVGKGKGNRINEHELEARRGVCSRKCRKINEIKIAGREILKRKVAVFWDEQAAYKCEAEWIDMYGLESLTNVIPGGSGAYAFANSNRKTVASTSKELTPEMAWACIKKVDGQFAWWAKHTLCGAYTITVEITGTCADRLYTGIANACFSMMPKVFKVAVTKYEDEIRALLAEFGVSIENGRPQTQN